MKSFRNPAAIWLVEKTVRHRGITTILLGSGKLEAKVGTKAKGKRKKTNKISRDHKVW